jgi:hypothetical protein
MFRMAKKNRGASPLLVVKNRFPEYLADRKYAIIAQVAELGKLRELA